jgi:hypothetical protein
MVSGRAGMVLALPRQFSRLIRGAANQVSETTAPDISDAFALYRESAGYVIARNEGSFGELAERGQAVIALARRLTGNLTGDEEAVVLEAHKLALEMLDRATSAAGEALKENG